MVKNKIRTIQTDYLRPSRTIETILLSNQNKEKVVYMYNYAGNHFRVFFNVIDLMTFFDDKDINFKEFDDENEVDNFLMKFEIE